MRPNHLQIGTIMRHFVASATGTTTVVNHVQALRPVSKFVVGTNGATAKQTRLEFVTIGYAKS